MAGNVDIEQFVVDYRQGIKDRDLLAKHRLSAKELIRLVKKLIGQGVITKEQYFTRNRLVEEAKIHEEKQFLKSLYHCPVCSHMHPQPFTRCPACGAEISDSQAADTRQDISTYGSAVGAHSKAREGLVSDVARIPARSGGEPQVAAAKAVETNPGFLKVDQATGSIGAAFKGVDRSPGSDSVAWREFVGARLERLSLLPGCLDSLVADNYNLSEVISSGPYAALYRADPASGDGPSLSVRIFDSRFAEGTDRSRLFAKIIEYQSAMVDSNILRVRGLASLHGEPVLVYEYVPTNLEALLQGEPEGLSLDLLTELLPQILNSIGYSHMHRGSDGVVRRLPLLNLQLASFLYEDRRKVVKLVDCGVWKSLVDLRGYRGRLWEEPGVDLSALAPETFIMGAKSFNPFSADVYALGIVLYQLATGKTPFIGSTVEDYGFLHRKTFAIPPRVHRYKIPGWLDAMILKCLEKEPAKRWRSATQMELSIGKELSE